jgi:hypothetical protein
MPNIVAELIILLRIWDILGLIFSQRVPSLMSALVVIFSFSRKLLV